MASPGPRRGRRANAAVCLRVYVFVVAPGRLFRQRKFAAGGGATGWRSHEQAATFDRLERRPRRGGERAGGAAQPIRLAAHPQIAPAAGGREALAQQLEAVVDAIGRRRAPECCSITKATV